MGHPGIEDKDMSPIESKQKWILALGVASLATLGRLRGLPASGASNSPLSFESRCAVVETGSIDGFVTNLSRENYRAFGEVRFVFATAQPPRAEILVQANVQLPAGGTVRVARAKLEPPLRPGETCRLEADAAVHRE
jgi:hypothetical protein